MIDRPGASLAYARPCGLHVRDPWTFLGAHVLSLPRMRRLQVGPGPDMLTLIAGHSAKGERLPVSDAAAHTSDVNSLRPEERRKRKWPGQMHVGRTSPPRAVLSRNTSLTISSTHVCTAFDELKEYPSMTLRHCTHRHTETS